MSLDYTAWEQNIKFRSANREDMVEYGIAPCDVMQWPFVQSRRLDADHERIIIFIDNPCDEGMAFRMIHKNGRWWIDDMWHRVTGASS